MKRNPALLLLLATLGSACTCGASESPSPSASESESESESASESESGSESASRCRASPPVRVLRSTAPIEAVAISLDPRPSATESGGFVAIAQRPADGLTLVALGPTGRPIDPSRPNVLSDAGSPFAFVSVARHHLLLTALARDGVAALRAFTLRRDPFVVAAQVDTPPLPPFQSLKVASSGQLAVVAFSDGVAPASVLRLAVGHEGALDVELRARSSEDPRSWDLLGLTTTGPVIGLIERVGGAEDPRSEVHLVSVGDSGTTPTDARVDALREAIAIESFALDDEGTDVVAAFEFSRPVLIRLAWDGELASSTPLAPGRALSGVFAGRLRALLRDGGRALVVENGAGDVVGELALPAQGLELGIADVARAEDGFVVVVVYERGSAHEVSTVHVRCSAE